MQQTDQCEQWLKAAANLHVDRKDNIAPHKPLLLLVVAELAEQEKLEPILPLTGELVFRFLDSRRKPPLAETKHSFPCCVTITLVMSVRCDERERLRLN